MSELEKRIEKAVEDCYWKIDFAGVPICRGVQLPCCRAIETGKCDAIAKLLEKAQIDGEVEE